MLKQYLSLKMLIEDKKPERGYDFSFNQYVNEIQTLIPTTIDLAFKKQFSNKFFSRFKDVTIASDDYDTFFSMLESDFEIILPLYEKKFLAVKNLSIEDLQEHSKSTSKSKQASDSKAKSFSSSFPAEMIETDSLQYASDGTHSMTEGKGTAETQTDVWLGNKLDKIQDLLSSQRNIIDEAVNEFKHLFIMIY